MAGLLFKNNNFNHFYYRIFLKKPLGHNSPSIFLCNSTDYNQKELKLNKDIDLKKCRATELCIITL